MSTVRSARAGGRHRQSTAAATPRAPLLRRRARRHHHRQSSTGWYVLIAGLLAAGGVVALLLDNGSSGPGRPGTPSAGPLPVVQSALGWARGNLPQGSHVLVDDATATLLGPPGGLVVMRLSGPWQCAGFVVVTPALRTAAGHDEPLAACVQRSLPVARFAAGTAAVDVRAVVADVAAATRQRAQDAAARASGGAQLAQNAAITMTPAQRQVVVAGGLDLRAETVLAQLGQRVPVTVTALVPDPAEAAAGLPARTVDVRVDPSAGAAVRTMLAGLSPDFTPTAVHQIAPGTFRLRWPLQVTPVPVLR